jgi:soluble lytic murein transglycosylase-like protein
MRIARLSAVLFASLIAFPSAAHAAVAHVVQPGETLWSIAAANNLTTRTVAAFNGISEDAHVVLGSTVMVPTVSEGAVALQRTGVSAGPTSSSASAAPAPMGGYTVRPGDTLSALAANSGVSVSAMAAMNGLDPNGLLLAGTVIKLPSGAPAPPLSSEPAPAQRIVPAAAPVPTPTRVSASTVQSTAAANGVPASLAAAIAWQESGFNNAMVSGANARGVMQMTPGAWNYVQALTGRRLDPNSAADNVSAGVLYLKNLLQQTGGDQNAAIAAYYQGLGSLRSRGMFDDTRRYVANVQALRARFGG